MASRLRISAIHSVGAVDEGDNPPALLGFWKMRQRKRQPEHGNAPSGGREEGEPMEADVIVEEPEVTKAEPEAALPEVEKQAEEPVEVDKRLDEIAKRLEDAEVAKAAAEAALEAEVEKRECGEWVEKARPLEALLGDPAGMGPVLRKLHRADPDAYGLLSAAFDAALARVDLAKLFAESGTGESASADPLSDRDRWVKEFRKLHPDKTVAEARNMFWQEHPEAKKASREGVA